MLNMFSFVNLLFESTYNFVAYVARKLGHKEFAEKVKQRAERCAKKIEFYEGAGSWPGK